MSDEDADGITLTVEVTRGTDTDDDHVQVDAEYRRIDDRNRAEVFAFHEECWIRQSEDWEVPA